MTVATIAAAKVTHSDVSTPLSAMPSPELARARGEDGRDQRHEDEEQQQETDDREDPVHPAEHSYAVHRGPCQSPGAQKVLYRLRQPS